MLVNTGLSERLEDVRGLLLTAFSVGNVPDPIDEWDFAGFALRGMRWTEVSGAQYELALDHFDSDLIDAVIRMRPSLLLYHLPGILYRVANGSLARDPPLESIDLRVSSMYLDGELESVFDAIQYSAIRKVAALCAERYEHEGRFYHFMPSVEEQILECHRLSRRRSKAANLSPLLEQFRTLGFHSAQVVLQFLSLLKGDAYRHLIDVVCGFDVRSTMPVVLSRMCDSDRAVREATAEALAIFHEDDLEGLADMFIASQAGCERATLSLAIGLCLDPSGAQRSLQLLLSERLPSDIATNIGQYFLENFADGRSDSSQTQRVILLLEAAREFARDDVKHLLVDILDLLR